MEIFLRQKIWPTISSQHFKGFDFVLIIILIIIIFIIQPQVLEEVWFRCSVSQQRVDQSFSEGDQTFHEGNIEISGREKYDQPDKL